MKLPSQTSARLLRANPTTFGPLALKPGESRHVSLGRYLEADSAPEFDVHYQPTVPHIVAHEIIKLPLGDDQTYVLTCQLQSFSDQPVAVTIQRRSS